MRLSVPVAAVLVGALAPLTACTENTPSPSGGSGADPRAVTVTSTDDGCELSSAEVPAGTLTFDVTNAGSQVTEFYLLAEDGLRIVGEIENIGPQLTRQLVVAVPHGSYVSACKPGMTGEGIRDTFVVSASDQEQTVPADQQVLVDQALANYRAYVQDQSDQLLLKTRQFVELYRAGDDDAARALYPDARVHWERIETVAESFGDLDPKMDAREVDLEPGQKWTGWHRIEKDLWPPADAPYTALSAKQRATFADDLLANTETLDGRIQQLEFTVDQIANGSRGLLEEVAKGKVTGEEEIWSHTDLWDFQANIDGARVAFEGLQPIVEENDPDLAATLTARFAEIQDLLDAERSGDGFTLYDELPQQRVTALAAAVNALAEPLSRLTAVVLA